MCFIQDCTAPVCANVTSIAVSPPSGKMGTKFVVNMGFRVVSPAGTGMIRVNTWAGHDPNVREQFPLLMSANQYSLLEWQPRRFVG